MLPLPDLSVVIPVRIDGPDRLRNLTLVLGYLRRIATGLEIVVVEDDVTSQLGGRLGDGVRHYFRPGGPAFLKTHSMNFGAAIATRSFIAIYDCDMIVKPGALRAAYCALTERSFDALYPYNQLMLQIRSRFVTGTRELDPEFVATLPFCPLDFEGFEHEMCEVLYGDRAQPSTGGIFMMGRETFLRSGGYNTNIINYGYEDTEFDIRLRKLGASIGRLPSFNAYHLEHRRSSGSQFNAFEPSNREELVRTIRMTPLELRYFAGNRFMQLRPASDTELGLMNSSELFSLEPRKDS